MSESTVAKERAALDNLTHGLMGVAIGMLRRRDGGPGRDAPLSHTDKAVAWATFIAAELPDIDIFFGAITGRPMDEYRYHRGYTHALVVAPLVALIATGVTKLIWREAKAKTVYAWSLAAVLVAHLLNDWMTGWGTRLLLPFSEARLALDWVPIIDLLYTLPLLAAVLLAWRRPQLRRRAAVGVLSYLAVYTVGYRAVSQAVVAQAVRAHYTGQPVTRFQVSPDLFNPLAWQFTVDLGDRYEQGQALPFGAVQADRVTPIAAGNPADIAVPVAIAVRSSPELTPFFEQFAFATVESRRVAGGYEARIADVRYGWPGGGGIAYTVHLNENLRITGITAGGR